MRKSLTFSFIKYAGNSRAEEEFSFQIENAESPDFFITAEYQSPDLRLKWSRNFAFQAQLFKKDVRNRIVNVASSYCIDVNRIEYRLAVIQQECHNKQSQVWHIHRDGLITTPAYPGFCLDKVGISRALQLWPCNGSKSQKWYAVKYKDYMSFPEGFYTTGLEASTSISAATIVRDTRYRTLPENLLAVMNARADFQNVVGRDEKEQRGLEIAKSLTDNEIYLMYARKALKDVFWGVFPTIYTLVLIMTLVLDPIQSIRLISLPFLVRAKPRHLILFIVLLIALSPIIPDEIAQQVLLYLRQAAVSSTVLKTVAAIFEFQYEHKLGRKERVMEDGLSRRLQKRAILKDEVFVSRLNHVYP